MRGADAVVNLTTRACVAWFAVMSFGCDGDRLPAQNPVTAPVVTSTEPNDSNAFYSDRFFQCAYQTEPRDIATPDPTRFLDREFTGSRLTMKYRLFVPVDYDTTTTYPLVMILHAGGARGPDNVNQLDAGAYLLSSPEVQQEHASFVFAPKVADPEGDWANAEPTQLTDELFTALEILDNLEGEFSIEPKREYVMGSSLGGRGTWDLLTKKPGRFAAYIPYSNPIIWAYVQRPAVVGAALLKGQPYWFLYGANDGNGAIKPWWEAMVAVLRASGDDPRFTEYIGGEHVIGTCVYTEPELIPWLFSHSLSP